MQKSALIISGDPQFPPTTGRLVCGNPHLGCFREGVENPSLQKRVSGEFALTNSEGRISGRSGRKLHFLAERKIDRLNTC
jgi:hypothetical protein